MLLQALMLHNQNRFLSNRNRFYILTFRLSLALVKSIGIQSFKMSASPAKLQDMPPKGGYQGIPFERIPAKKYFKGWQLFTAYAGFTTFGLFIYYLNCKENHRNEIEMRSAKNVIFPLLLAERDREYLKQLRRNREDETELMKDVKGWQVGTWYGEPIFKTLPKDKFIDPSFQEFYVHADYKEMAKRKNVKMMS